MKYQSYEEYLLSKQISASPVGFDIDIAEINPILHDWQKLGLQWSLKIGKALAGWKMGLGKTFLEIEFARLVHKHTGQPTLIVCPLAVARQTIREAKKLNVDIELIRSMDDARLADSPITIVNFDMFRRKFTPDFWKKGALIIDESSILASYQGETKKFVIPFMNQIRYGLCASGTFTRNDYMEIGNQAEALGVIKSNQMISNWFMNSSMKDEKMVAGKYKIKPMGEEDFWRWVTTWALVIDTPSVIGGSDIGYSLPPLNMCFYTLDVDHKRAWEMIDHRGQHYLFLPDNPSSTDMWREKQATYQDRVCKAIELDEGVNDYHILWCDLNNESELLAKKLEAKYGKDWGVEVKGDDKLEEKEAKLDAFSRGDARRIVTKSKIAGLGLNWQHCNVQTMVSINYSWEKFAQMIARTNRYGNKRQTTVNMIATETEQGIIGAIKRKEMQDRNMHVWIKRIYDKFGLWRTDRKLLTTDTGTMEMELPQWL